MWLCDQLRKLVANERSVGRMSLEPCIVIYFTIYFSYDGKSEFSHDVSHDAEIAFAAQYCCGNWYIFLSSQEQHLFEIPFLPLIKLGTVFWAFNIEWFLKDLVTLKTGVMADEISS